jgi:hypothetical protein
MPFYLRYLRSFIMKHEGQVVWLKGNTAQETAAYLIFESSLREEIISLMAKPLAELGFYEVTAISPNEVTSFLFSKDKVGSLLVGTIEIGEPLSELTQKVRRGFWLPAPNTPEACSGAIFLKAQKATWVLSDGKWWLQLQQVKEQICRSDGTPVHVKITPELWLPQEAVQIATWDSPEWNDLEVPAA